MGLRLAKRDVRTVSVYRTSKTDSGYVGTVETETLIGTADAVVSPVTDEMSAKIYGDRVGKMKQFLFLTPVDIRYGDKLLIGETKYRVIAKPEYTDHIVVRGEAE